MRTRTVVAIAALLMASGAVAIACSGEVEEPGTAPTCDPAKQVCDETGGGDTGVADGDMSDSTVEPDTTVTVDTSLSDVPGDGIYIPPDGYVPCLDGGFVCGPDGSVLPIPDGAVT